MSSPGFNQNIWGPPMWFILHTITFNYPIEPKECDKKRVYNFFISLYNVLPCSICRKNYKQHLLEYPIKLDSRKDLVYWLINLHNEVNGCTGKRYCSYEEVIKKYEKTLNKELILDNVDIDNEPCHDKNNTNNFILIVLILIFGIVFIFFYRKK